MDKISISEGFSRWMKYLYPRKKRLLSLSLSPHAAAVSGTVEERATDMVMMLSGMKFIFYNGTIATWNRIPHCCHIFTYFA